MFHVVSKLARYQKIMLKQVCSRPFWWRGQFPMLCWRKATLQQGPSAEDPYPVPSQPPLWPEPRWNFFSAWIGAFAAISATSVLVYFGSLNGWNFPQEQAQYLLMSIGASSVLFYAAPQAALSQPYNDLVGSLGSAFIGVTMRVLIPSVALRWLSASLAVSRSIVFMMTANAVYPPAGATALSAATLAQLPSGWGYSFLISPMLVDLLILFVIALLSNNLFHTRHYPDRWWPQYSKSK